jgi:hypothetical protein
VDKEETLLEMHTRQRALQEEKARRETALGMYKRDLQRVKDELAVLNDQLQALKL